MITALLIFLLIYVLVCRPYLHYSLRNTPSYTELSNTRLINGFFIILVVLSHLFHHTPGIKEHLCFTDSFFLNNVVGKIGQLMVAPFFFFSGYGIASSFDHKPNYKFTLRKRLCRIFINFNLAVICYIALSYYFDSSKFIANFDWTHLFLSCIALESWGNQNWFIFITFCLYVFTITSCVFKSSHLRLLSVLILTLVAIRITTFHKPYFWVDTVLCFPAGMFFYQKQELTERFLQKTKVPVWGIGLLLILIAQFTRYLCLGFKVNAKLSFSSALLINFPSIIFAFGILLLFGCISWKQQPKFMTLIGGYLLFPIYIFHMLPILLFSHINLQREAPNVYILFVILSTAILSYFSIYIFKLTSKLLG